MDVKPTENLKFNVSLSLNKIWKLFSTWGYLETDTAWYENLLSNGFVLSLESFVKVSMLIW